MNHISFDHLFSSKRQLFFFYDHEWGSTNTRVAFKLDREFDLQPSIFTKHDENILREVLHLAQLVESAVYFNIPQSWLTYAFANLYFQVTYLYRTVTYLVCSRIKFWLNIARLFHYF